jgi:hypothetical protein
MSDATVRNPMLNEDDRHKVCSKIGSILNSALHDPPEDVEFYHPIATEVFYLLRDYGFEVDKVLVGPEAISVYVTGTDLAVEVARL